MVFTDIDNIVLLLFKGFENPYLTAIFKVIYYSIYLYIVFMIYLLYRRGSRKHLAAYLVLLLSSVFFIEILKRLVHKARPDNPLTVGDLFSSSKNSSFPSRHTAVSVFNFGTIYQFVARYEKYILFIYSALICVSVLYLRLHYLSDVLFGLLIGIITSFLFHMDLLGKNYPKMKSNVKKLRAILDRK